MKKIITALIIAVLFSALALTSCNEKDISAEKENQSIGETTPASGNETITGAEQPINAELKITFDGDSIKVSETGSSVQIDGNSVTLCSGGKYILEGSLNDGCVIVEAEKSEKVELILNGVSIKSSKSAPLYIKSCDKVTISSADGTVNEFSDALSYELPAGEDKPNACIYSSEDIDFEGNGTIIVKGNYNNGIGSKNDIDIESGIIEVKAANNAIKGNDSVSIMGGVVRITGSDDGIKSDNETDAAKGFIRIEGGDLEIKADDDAIQAYSSVSITGGKITTNVGGKAVKCDGSVTLAEGVLTEN